MASAAVTTRPTPVQRLWHRELADYPMGTRRMWHLGIVVLTTIVLYYENFVAGAVATEILADFKISFLYFAVVIAIANAVGALGSLASGIADRVGRANLTVYGLIVVSLVTLLWIPNTHSGVSFAIASSVAGIFEGVILVSTPALVRDFSPQVGRAQAMAFWTMGPVLGSLLVTLVTSSTLDSLPRWQDQFVIAGIAGLVVSLFALVTLRELNAEHRNRIVGAIEADTAAKLAARGLSAEQASRKPYRQMFTPAIIFPSIAISLFLLFYYTAVAFLPVYFQTTLGFTSAQANSLLNWLWAATAVSMLVFGVLSDKLRVRKPFMVAGGVFTVVVDLAFLAKADAGEPTFATVAVLLVLSGIWSGAVYVPWMAAFTETVEERNPALTATGLAIWGWILRVVVAAAFITIPLINSATNPLVADGPAVQARLVQLEKAYPQLAVEAQAHPEVFAELGKYANPADIPPEVLTRAVETVGADALTELQGSAKAQADLKYLGSATGSKVAQAKEDAPGQWKAWFLICTIGAALFVPLSARMAGHWRPRPQHDPHAVDHALKEAAVLAAEDAANTGVGPDGRPQETVRRTRVGQ